MLPADRSALVLFVEPFFQRREVVHDCRRIHLALAGSNEKCFLPRTTLTQFEHLCETRARFSVAVNRAAIQRSGATRGLRECAVELELENICEEVSRVGRVRRDV